MVAARNTQSPPQQGPRSIFSTNNDCRKTLESVVKVNFNTIQSTHKYLNRCKVPSQNLIQSWRRFFKTQIWSNPGVGGVEADEDMAPCVPDRPRPQLTGCNQNMWWGGPRYHPTHLCQKPFSVLMQGQTRMSKLWVRFVAWKFFVCLLVVFLLWQHCSIVNW